MKKVFALILVFAVLCSLAACSKGDVLAGSWKGITEDGSAEWTFKDGKCTLHIESDGFAIDNEGTYELHEETGVVTIMMNLWSEAKNYQYTLNGNTLTLTANDAYSPNYELTKK